jgi:3-oxoadipate enol-lactonase
VRLVFIHGAGCTGAVFGQQVAAFDGSIALTLPGHTIPGEPQSIEAFADAVVSDLEQRDIHDALLCGHSMGGAVALELALRGEPRVRAVAMISSGAKLRVAPVVFESFESDFAAGVRAFTRYAFAEPTPERVDACVTMMTGVGQAQTIRDFRACDAFDRLDRLGEVDLPLLAATGEKDLLTPPKFARVIADRVPRAQARILPAAGHFLMLECPAALNDALRSFVTHVESLM